MGNSGRSSLNFDRVRRGTLEGLLICIGCEETGAVPTRWMGMGCRDMDSRDVLENEASEGGGRACSCELRFDLRKMEANTPRRLPSVLSLRVEEALFEVAEVSMVSTGCNDPLLAGSWKCTNSMGVSWGNFSDRSAGSTEASDTTRVCIWVEALPGESRAT
jgi:hypothetical protein